MVEAGEGRADALVVLAGSSTYRERARHAARLYAEGRAPLVILTDDGLRSGWSVAEQRNPLFVERAAEELRRGGVPPDRIEFVSPPASSTYEEAVRVREFAAARGLRSLLLVPAAYQSRRALWTFTRVFRASGVRLDLDAPPPGEQTPRPALWWLDPLGWQLVPGEYTKLAYYVLHYR
jgi:uncharacterized SAM-binding protein YcdF (DUF218 family)